MNYWWFEKLNWKPLLNMCNTFYNNLFRLRILSLRYRALRTFLIPLSFQNAPYHFGQRVFHVFFVCCLKIIGGQNIFQANNSAIHWMNEIAFSEISEKEDNLARSLNFLPSKFHSTFPLRISELFVWKVRCSEIPQFFGFSGNVPRMLTVSFVTGSKYLAFVVECKAPKD